MQHFVKFSEAFTTFLMYTAQPNSSIQYSKVSHTTPHSNSSSAIGINYITLCVHSSSAIGIRRIPYEGTLTLIIPIKSYFDIKKCNTNKPNAALIIKNIYIKYLSFRKTNTRR